MQCRATGGRSRSCWPTRPVDAGEQGMSVSRALPFGDVPGLSRWLGDVAVCAVAAVAAAAIRRQYLDALRERCAPISVRPPVQPQRGAAGHELLKAVIAANLPKIRSSSWVVHSPDERVANYCGRPTPVSGFRSWAQPVVSIHNHLRTLLPPAFDGHWQHLIVARILIPAGPSAPKPESVRGRHNAG